MPQRLRRRAPLLRVEVQAPIEEIHEKRQLLRFFSAESLCALPHQPRLQITARLFEVKDPRDHPPRDLVFFRTPEVEHLVEVQVGECTSLEHLRRELPTALHDRTQHLVVVASGEKDLSRI